MKRGHISLWHGHGNFVAQQDLCAGTLPSAATDTFLVLCGALRADAHTATLHSLVEVAKRFVVSGKLADVIVGSGGQRADRTVRRCHVLLGIGFSYRAEFTEELGVCLAFLAWDMAD
jgi:hypothetical protein